MNLSSHLILGGVLALLVSCGSPDSRLDAQPAAKEIELRPVSPAQPSSVPCDTLSFGQRDFWRFLPIRCQLHRPLFSPTDSQQVQTALNALALPFDSLWTMLGPSGMQSIRIDSVTLRIDIHLYEGIAEEIELERTGRSRVGNWSGRDGTLTIDRRTGAHTYGLWQ